MKLRRPVTLEEAQFEGSLFYYTSYVLQSQHINLDILRITDNNTLKTLYLCVSGQKLSLEY